MEEAVSIVKSVLQERQAHPSLNEVTLCLFSDADYAHYATVFSKSGAN